VKSARLQNEILSRLKADYDLKERGPWLRLGKCPTCRKREMFISKENPWVLRCGRTGKCGVEFHIKDLYSDLFEKFNDKYKATPEKPNATADAYMEFARGLDPEKMVGWYRQGSFWHTGAVGTKGSATVRFDINRENDVYMERLVEPVLVLEEDGSEKLRRAHFKGSYRGLWWMPPGMTIEDGDEVWIVEACIDAASLYLAGTKAVAALSCSNYPGKSLTEHEAKNVKWVWALDNDKAGRKYAPRHIETMKEAGFEDVFCALIPQKDGRKKDFNDAYKIDGLKASDLKKFKYEGALHIVQRPLEKALLIWAHTGRNGFHFEHRNRLYYFDVDIEKYTKCLNQIEDGEEVFPSEEDKMQKAAMQSQSLTEMANCYPQFLYFQVNALTDESWYYTRIRFPHGSPPVKNTFTGAQLSAPTEFKKRLLSIAAGAMFTGSKGQLDGFLKKQLYAIKTVETVDFIGYSKEHCAYVFNDFAVSSGQVAELNDEDFFEVGKLSIKSLNQSVHLHIGDDQEYQQEWVQLIWECFGPKGMLAVAFWFGSLFAEQIRATQKSYPFLEIVGEPGAGKSTLIEFLWKLLGRQDYEGFDPSKSTLAARSRNFAQVSNMPVVLIEADRDEDTAKARKFDWDELKTAYNGRASRARGVKTSGNETYEPPFRGAIVISQNDDVNASEAVLQRIVHLGFDRSCHSEASRKAAERLESMPVQAVSAFLRKAIRMEKQAVNTIIEQTPVYEKKLMSLVGMNSVRLAKNHAQILAAADAMADLLGLNEDHLKAMYDQACHMALDRQEAVSSDHHIVREFWETYEFLNSGEEGRQTLNHSLNDQEIAINLNHFVLLAANKKQQIPPLADLKRHLKTSQLHKFRDIKTVKSGLAESMNRDKGYTLKCWVFGREK